MYIWKESICNVNLLNSILFLQEIPNTRKIIIHMIEIKYIYWKTTILKKTLLKTRSKNSSWQNWNYTNFLHTIYVHLDDTGLSYNRRKNFNISYSLPKIQKLKKCKTCTEQVKLHHSVVDDMLSKVMLHAQWNAVKYVYGEQNLPLCHKE